MLGQGAYVLLGFGGQGQFSFLTLKAHGSLRRHLGVKVDVLWDGIATCRS